MRFARVVVQSSKVANESSTDNRAVQIEAQYSISLINHWQRLFHFLKILLGYFDQAYFFAGSADFSDATLIVQVGATDRLTYHRRQSHAAASGAESILLCSPCDEPTVTHELNGFPLESQSAPALTPNGNQSFMRATSNFKLKANIRGAFEWFLRTYKSPQFNFTDEALVEAGKEFCKGLGQHSVPELPVNIVDSIGLRRVCPFILIMTL